MRVIRRSVNFYAVKLLEEVGVDMFDNHSKCLEEFRGLNLIMWLSYAKRRRSMSLFPGEEKLSP